ncbi:cell division suppressor protein YneA [Brevibacillus massiliensis]|uniref:cell division suppressor protein YneA n=2 Tax=Brevibacillus massiliensis TaxID=1118054 RepID=UPI0002FEAA57|nr:LysM peptidoglycan-binding domain-containing protein [Brevibacillus massiliensis]
MMNTVHKRRGRLGIRRGQALLMMLTFCFILYILSDLVFASEPEAAIRMEVTVQEGDSLWKLAAEYHDPDKVDIRDYVQLLKDVNHLEDPTIYPGQTLIIPVQK